MMTFNLHNTMQSNMATNCRIGEGIYREGLIYRGGGVLEVNRSTRRGYADLHPRW